MGDYHGFLPLPTTAPSFLCSVATTGSVFRLETSASSRMWGSPTNRWIRISSSNATDLWASFGTTAVTDLPVIGSHMFLQMPGDYVIPVIASKPGISLLTNPAAAAISTDVVVTLGTLVNTRD